MRRTTIKDIAGRCAVSRALVSAVLSNKKGTIRYSQERRELILKAAKAMNYQPNRLAYAIKSGIVPLVAVCLHIKFLSTEEINSYLQDILAGGALNLQRIGFEMIFVPFLNQDEQLRRIQSLIGGGLVGGIISNFIPENEKRVVSYLKKAGIPFAMLGNIPDKSVPCIYSDDENIKKKVLEFADDNGFQKTIQALLAKDNNGTYLPEYKLLNSSPELVDENDIDFQDSRLLFAALGESSAQFLMNEKKVPRKNIISIETKRLMIRSRPSLYVASPKGKIMAVAVKLIKEWIETGSAPPNLRRYIHLAPQELELVV